MHDHHRIRPVRDVSRGPLRWNHVVHLYSEALRIGRVEHHPPTPTAPVLTFQLEGGVGPAASGQHHGRRLLMPGFTPHCPKRAVFVGGSDHEQSVLCAIVWMLPRVHNGDEVAAGGGRHGHPGRELDEWVAGHQPEPVRTHPAASRIGQKHSSTIEGRHPGCSIMTITVRLLDRYQASSSPPRYSAPASGADAATLGPLGMKPK